MRDARAILLTIINWWTRSQEMTKYRKRLNGEPVPLKAGKYIGDNTIDAPELLKFACCDCGMVHTIIPVVEKKNVIFHFYSEPRRTAQLRRTEYGNLHKGSYRWKLVRLNEL